MEKVKIESPHCPKYTIESAQKIIEFWDLQFVRLWAKGALWRQSGQPLKEGQNPQVKSPVTKAPDNRSPLFVLNQYVTLAFDQDNLCPRKLPVISRNCHPEGIPGALDIREESEQLLVGD